MSFIRPKANRVFNCNSSRRLRFVTKFRAGLSHLREQKFKHSFQDSFNCLCSCSLDFESTLHYFLHCPLFTIERYTLLNTISPTDNKLLDSNESNLIQYHLFSDPSRDTKTNTDILIATVNYVLTTKRFDEQLLRNVMFDKNVETEISLFPTLWRLVIIYFVFCNFLFPDTFTHYLLYGG